MNRHDRRKQRSLDRKARRSGSDVQSGKVYQAAGLPPGYQDHPAFKRGQEAAKTGTMGPEYIEQVEQAARKIAEWVHAQPTRPDLRWIEQKDDSVFVIADLAMVIDKGMLADSADARSLLEWLDEETGKVLTLNQAVWALRWVRAIPMPDGSYYGVETVREIPAQTLLHRMGTALGGEQLHIEGSPCGHCGKVLDGSSKASDGTDPEPGDITFCIYCGGLNRFGEGLRLEGLSDEAAAEHLGEQWPTVRDAREMLRAKLMEMLGSKMGAKAPAGEA